jgi:hypothetical protein
MPGFLEPIWETIFRVATWSALIFGALSIGSAFVSAWVGWEITDATQKDADTRIKAADVRIADAMVHAAEANQKAEEERLARVKLETRIAPRQITHASASLFHHVSACSRDGTRSVCVRAVWMGPALPVVVPCIM